MDLLYTRHLDSLCNAFHKIRLPCNDAYPTYCPYGAYHTVRFPLWETRYVLFTKSAYPPPSKLVMGHPPQQVSVTFTTWIASLFAGVWRVMLTPLDTCKTVLQVEGPKGFASLMKKVSPTYLQIHPTNF